MNRSVLKKQHQLSNNIMIIYRDIDNLNNKTLSFKDKALISYIEGHLSYIKVLSLAIGENLRNNINTNDEYLISEMDGAIECVNTFQESINNRIQ